MKEKRMLPLSEEIPIFGETDVAVIGGGIAGVAAALAAARSGKKVMLFEKSILLGGLATRGMVCIYLPLCDGAGNKIFGGIAEELLHTSIKYGYNNLPQEWKMGTVHLDNPTGRYRTQFNIPAFELALDELMEQEGVDVVYDTVFSAPIMDGNRCEGIIVENKSGRGAYMTKMVIDATGDADVFERAGAECVTNSNMLTWWCFELTTKSMLTGIEKGQMLRTMNLRWAGHNPCSDNSHVDLPTFYGHNAEGVNDYVKMSHKVGLDYLKKHQGSDYAMVMQPSMPQFRTTRRIKGAKPFEMVPERYETHSVGCVCDSMRGKSPVYEFPLEALIDSRLENVIAAGRMVATPGAAWDMMRTIPGCAFTGQAAGQLAANAIDDNTSVQNVDIERLQGKLAESGLFIHVTEPMKMESKIHTSFVNDCVHDENVVSDVPVINPIDEGWPQERCLH